MLMFILLFRALNKLVRWHTESFLPNEIFLIQKSVSLTVTVAKSLKAITVSVC